MLCTGCFILNGIEISNCRVKRKLARKSYNDHFSFVTKGFFNFLSTLSKERVKGGNESENDIIN